MCGPAEARHDREEARTHAADIVAIVSAQIDLKQFKADFQRQFHADWRRLFQRVVPRSSTPSSHCGTSKAHSPVPELEMAQAPPRARHELPGNG